MNEPRELSVETDLEALITAIMRSPIVVRRVALAERLADWERTRRSPDVDLVVLAWIASHVDGPRRRAALS
jgi:hypothetical protein